MSLETTVSVATEPNVTAVSVDGVQRLATEFDLRTLLAGGKFLWVDMAGGSAVGRAKFLGELAFDRADVAWLQRFSQAGSMVISRRRLLVVTWLAEPSGRSLIEIHILGSEK